MKNLESTLSKASISQQGYVLVSVVITLSMAGLLLSGSMLQSTLNMHTTERMEQRSVDFLAVESGISRAESWLRLNSQSMVKPFRRDQMYNLFERVATPVVGANDTGTFQVASKIKLKGTNNTVFLVNDASLGTASFPATENITTNIVFDTVSEFAAANLGDALVRITLYDIIAKDPTKDYGAAPNPSPETDFYPVYKVDALTSLDSGAHVSSFVTGNVINIFDMSFYGEDYLEFRQSCDSYDSSVGSYNTSTNRNANCSVGSNSQAAVHKSEEVYGSIRTNGTINAASPYGGEACADFVSGCPNKGETCSGEDCGVPLLEVFDPWATYCPTSQGNLTITSDTTLSLASNNPTDNCWDTVTINNGVTLTLDTTDYQYFFKSIVFKHNTSTINVSPATSGEVVELYTEEFDGGKLNGNQAVNASGDPGEFTIYYLGTDTLTLNGNADMNLAMVAPNARVAILGNFDFFGALLAKELNLSGSGAVHYDESLGGGGAIVDVKYRQNSVQQNYR